MFHAVSYVVSVKHVVVDRLFQIVAWSPKQRVAINAELSELL